MINESGKLQRVLPTMWEGKHIYRLNHKNKLNGSDLQKLQRELRDKPICRKYLGKFLQYANECLTSAEHGHDDIGQAIVEYGELSFVFRRIE